MPIPDAERATVNREKVCDYLLNLDHPDGGSKAIWFCALGYHQVEWETLARDLLEIAKTCRQFKTEHSPHGVKYIAEGTITRPNKRPVRVLTVWIVEQDSPPRLVATYPDVSP